MIRKNKIIYIGILLFIVSFLGGCSFLQKKSGPITEKTDPGVKAILKEKKTEQSLTADIPEKKNTKTTKVLGSHKAVTNDQIEKKLFPEKIIKMQRPVKGLNAYKTGYKKEQGNIVFNFDNASLSEVIRTFAKMLKIDYVLEAGIEGSVTVNTAGGLHKNEVFPVFFQILEANGLTAVKEGGIYRIIQTEAASKFYLNVHTRSDLSDVAPGERIIIQIISLDHIDVQEMVKIIEPFLSTQGTIITHDDSNTMLLIDKGIAVLKALDLIKVFDIDTFHQKNHRFYSIKNMDAENAMKLLNDLLKAYGKSEIKITLIPIKRLNSIIGVSSDSNVLDWITHMLHQLDVPGYDSTPKIYVYKVQNGSCAELGAILGNIFTKTDSEKETIPDIPTKTEDKKKSGMGSITATGLPGSTGGVSKPDKPKIQQHRASSPSDSGTDTLKGNIKIAQDEVRNALIIEAYPSDYQVVKKILKQLDIMPRQVLIEVTIADITLTDKSDLGIEWTKLVSGGSIGAGKTSGTIGKEGINFTIGLSDDWQTALSILASEDRVNILSTPVVLASDNKKATINVADDIPVVTTEYKSVAQGDDVIETHVQYRKTGIILDVTPHINDQGFVTMEISQEVSNVGDGVTAGGKEYPSFKTRNINTTFTVNHQQTIMIGGLMVQSDSDSKKGVPFLSAIPGIGWLFGQQTDSLIKTELTIFITPHVIYSMDDVEQITTEFKHRIKFMDISKKDI
ncbi:MAG: type II secretion system secretin GspD [Desulfobacula sp.]|uniref:type II secretion system secretin GspD n=1 Tax=Desulfobacula sp. TaxID=2593537 RepID=UPI0025BE9FA8|nr:type II secretion system secretin GspD [Desulfobacula sp.]MCD4719992.1 type II secretion system secretin GspD [Desulfobacula sp.]